VKFAIFLNFCQGGFMDDETHPANQNISFVQLTRNPKRELAKKVLATSLFELEAEGVDPQVLSDVLFDFTIIEMEPDDPISYETAMTWVAQLYRFRNRLQDKLDRIETLYSEKTH
jgi:hypothetical protein